MMSSPPEEEESKGRALVVAAHGRLLAVCWDAQGGVMEYIKEVTGFNEHMDFEKASVDHARLADGVWCGELQLIDNGPGDYPGSREHLLQFHNERPATAEEWKAHCEGEWPWEPLVPVACVVCQIDLTP